MNHQLRPDFSAYREIHEIKDSDFTAPITEFLLLAAMIIVPTIFGAALVLIIEVMSR